MRPPRKITERGRPVENITENITTPEIAERGVLAPPQAETPGAGDGRRPGEPGAVPGPLPQELETTATTGNATPLQSDAAALLPAAPLPITRDTPFRASGDCPFAVWEREFARLGARISGDALRAMYDAAAGVSALILDRLRAESSYGTASLPARNNVLGVRFPTSLDFMPFDSPADCVREIVRRWTDPSYKGGVYMPRELSIAGMLAKYSPPSENDTEALIRAAVANINAWRGDEAQEPSPSGELNFGPHPLPSGFQRRIVTKRPGSSGQGWQATSQARGPRLLVTFWHHTAGGRGFGKDECWQLFSIGGQREDEALTEAVIDRDGSGYVMNDPWSADPLEGSGRIPYASGPYVKSGGVLAPFVQRYGANAINELGWATEHCHAEGEAWGDALLDGSARLHGWVITRMGIPWDQYPRNPRMGGLWASFDHDDAANTTCPNMPAGVRAALVEAVRLEAKKLQTGSSVVSPPGPAPEPEPAAWPLTVSKAEVARFWSAEGGLVRYAADGSTQTYAFDEKGPISAMWMARAREAGRFPAALQWWQDSSGWNFVSFGVPGDVDWLLGIPSLTGRADWRWIDRAPAA